MSKFKVNDKIIVVDNTADAPKETIGMKGIVEYVYEDGGADVRFDRTIRDFESWAYNNKDIRLIEDNASRIINHNAWDKLADVILMDDDLSIKIKYFTPECTISKLEQSDWIDLRSAVDIEYKAGEFHLIPLGVAMELPEGYEAHVVPRSSTFKNYGIIQTNSMGIIDESYCGDNDQWFFPMYSLRDGRINKGNRICQFRIVPKMKTIELTEVDTLGNIDRGGHGSTGVS